MLRNRIFKKKTYTFSAFLKDFLLFHKNLPAIIMSQFNRRISKAFETRIMLAVTSVNGCIYCAWFHSKEALKAGLDPAEINTLLSSRLDGQIDESETAALTFALHYAETSRKPEPELVRRLFEVYGNEIASDIILKLGMIYFGNLCGNTFEGFLSRLKGTRPENGFWLSELVIFLIIAPLYGPLSILMKQTEKEAAL